MSMMVEGIAGAAKLLVAFNDKDPQDGLVNNKQKDGEARPTDIRKRLLRMIKEQSGSPQDEKTLKDQIVSCEKKLNNADYKIRISASNELEEICRTEMSPSLEKILFPVLIKALKDKNSSVRGNAISGFSQFNSKILPMDIKEKMTDPLYEELGSNDDATRISSVMLLSDVILQVSPDLKINTINKLINDAAGKKWRQRTSAEMVLSNIVDKNISPEIKIKIKKALEKKNEEVEKKMRDIKDAKSDQAKLKKCMEYINDKDGEVRNAAATYFVNFACSSQISIAEKEQMVPLMINAISDESGGVKLMAVHAMANLAASEISIKMKEKMVDPLIKTYNDEGGSIAQIAVTALMNLSGTNISPNSKAKVNKILDKYSDNPFNQRYRW